MRIRPLLLLFTFATGLAALGLGHGGYYPPPSGETGPVAKPPPSGETPGWGASGGGSWSGPGGVPSSPGSPLPSAPSTGSRGAGAPRTGVPGGPTPSPAGAFAAPTTSGTSGAAGDLTAWHYWWHFNKDPYLRLKERLYAHDPHSTGPELFLGRGTVEAAAVNERRPNRTDVRDRIVPALLHALERERSPAIVSSSLIALARIGDDPQESGAGLSGLASRFRTRLTDPSQEIQETAALALGILANERNVFLLAQLLENDSAALRSLGVDYRGSVPQRTRSFAAYGLGLIGNAASVPARAEIVRVLAVALEREGSLVARSDLAVACVTGLGLTRLPPRPASWGAPAAERELGADSLRSREDQVAWLLEQCDRRKLPDVVRAHLSIAVARLVAPVPEADPLRARTIERLAQDLEPLARIDNGRRRSAALALGLLTDADGDQVDSAARRALTTAVEDLADRQTRFFACLSLAQAASRPGAGEGNPFHALSGPEDVRGFLLARLARGRSGMRPWAALALGVLEHDLRELGRPGSGDARAAILELLGRARASEEIGALSIAAGLCGGLESAQQLRTRLAKVSDPDALVHLAVALGLAGERSDVEPLIELVRASRFRPALMQAGAVGAGLLGGERICAELVALLEQSTGLASQASICQALGYIGDRRAIEPLLVLLEDDRRVDLARGFAAVALGLIGDKEPLPWGSKLSLQANYRAPVPTFYDPLGAAGVLNLF